MPVSVTGVRDPDGDAFSLSIESIYQDESIYQEESLDKRPEGVVSADAWGIGSETAHLRAERRGLGDGRVYHVDFRAEDAFGATCSGTVTVCVPHQSSTDCVDQGPLFDSTRPPLLETSDPEPGAVDVPRTAWLRLTLRELGSGVVNSLGLRCGETRIGLSVYPVGANSVIANPEQELPPGSVCRVRWAGPGGPEEFFFATAPGGGSGVVTYDRRDDTIVTPFPDDYWLVDDPSTLSGKRLQLEIGNLGNAHANRWIRSISVALLEHDGFSPNQIVLLDFSESVDPASLPADAFASLDPFAQIALFDMNPSSADFGARVPFTAHVGNDPAPVSVDHTVVLFPAVTLDPGGSYGLVVTNRLHAAGNAGRPFAHSQFFQAVASAPTLGEASEAARARESIEPVLAFLASVPEVPIPREDVALALRISIRSVGFDPSDLVAVKEAYLAAPPPVLNVTSITATERRAAVIRGTVDLPIYIGPGDDLGAVNRDPVTGRPVPVEFEAVPFVLSLPHAAHEGPVPIVFFQHAWGGRPSDLLIRDDHEFLDDAGYAIGGIEDFSHRRFSAGVADVEYRHVLRHRRFPLLNIQSYMDMVGFLRAIQGLGERSFLPRGAPDDIPEIDPTRILFRGHSLGSQHAQAFLPLAPEVTAAVATAGAGRVYEHYMHQVQSRGNLAGYTKFGQALFGIEHDRHESYFLAKHLYREPFVIEGAADATPPSLLYLEGIGDPLISSTALRAAAHQFGIPLIRPLQRSTPVLEEVDAPLAANIAPDVTAGLFQYDPFETPSCRDRGLDGHICAGFAWEVYTQILHFFETALDPDRPAEIIDPFLSGVEVSAEDTGLEPAPRPSVPEIWSAPENWNRP
jgi:hypothetical protein